MKKVLLLLVITFTLFGCDQTQRHRKNAKVKCYKVANTSTPNTDDWLWYYIIFNQNGSYYYYTSPSYYSNIPSGSNWVSSTITPIQTETITEINSEQPVAEINEPMTELPNEIEVEGISETESTTDNSNTESSPSESSSESSSSGGESSGDGGSGGDGGGGGE